MQKHTVKGWLQLARPPVNAKKYEKIEFEASVNAAIEAMEKQVPKKPIEDRHHGIRYTEVYRCHSCNESFSGRGFAKYCYHCGQAIDWSKVGE